MLWHRWSLASVGLLSLCAGCFCHRCRTYAPPCPPPGAVVAPPPGAVVAPPPGAGGPVTVPANSPPPPTYGPRYYQPPVGSAQPPVSNGQRYYQPPVASNAPTTPRDPGVNDDYWRPVPNDARKLDSQPPNPRTLPNPDDAKARVMPPVPDEPEPAKKSQGDDLTPGDIGGFTRVNDNVFTGRQPFDAGWTWLKQHGFRTALYLKAPDADDTASKTNATSAGLNYLVLNVSPQTLNRALVERFGRLVSDKESYPVYVYDLSGMNGMARGTMWYLHFALNENRSDARALALQLGLREDDEDTKSWWLAINNLLKNGPKPPP